MALLSHLFKHALVCDMIDHYRGAFATFYCVDQSLAPGAQAANHR